VSLCVALSSHDFPSDDVTPPTDPNPAGTRRGLPGARLLRLRKRARKPVAVGVTSAAGRVARADRNLATKRIARRTPSEHRLRLELMLREPIHRPITPGVYRITMST